MNKFKVVYAVKHWWKSIEKQPQNSWVFSILWLLLISWVAFLWNLGSTGLVDETEPLFAEAGRQMIVTGDWITPYFNGETRFDKPPLIYWLMAICYKLFGVSEWAVRLPSALAAIALMSFCFYTLRYFGCTLPVASTAPEKSAAKRQLWLSAWIGSAIIAFNMQSLIWARQGVSDMLLSCCMGTALLCFFWGYAQEERERRRGGEGENFTPSLYHLPNRWYLAFYVLIALAVLTKGPIGIVLPGLIILGFLLYVGKFWEVLQEMGIVWGGLIFLVITLPWYVLVILRNGSAFIDSFFGYHNFERFTSVVNDHAAPWYFYFLIVLILFAPWSTYLPLAIARLRFWQPSFWRQQPRFAQLGLFALFWFAGIFIFFTIAVTKLPSYVLPLIPAAAILVALLWSEEITYHSSFVNSHLSLSTKDKGHRTKYGLLISGIINVLFLLILAAAFVYSPNFIGKDPAVLNLPELVEESGLPWRGGIIWVTTAIVSALLLRRRQQWRWLVCANLVGFVAFIIFVVTPTSFLLDQVRQLPLRQLSEMVAQVEQPGEELFMVGFKKPSVAFYTQRQVQFFKTNRRGINDLKNTADIQAHPSTVLILSRQKDMTKLRLQPQDYQRLDKKGRYQLIRVSKQKIRHGSK
ncbi:MAG: ArnT family glycosyltransferase [Xenococcaceae cyanobacterium]